MNIFLIFGYGIPEDVKQDKNYVTYLHITFNKMYELAAEKEAVIIPCGGPTNCTPPYEGTEAQEMERFITDHIEHSGLKKKPLPGKLSRRIHRFPPWKTLYSPRALLIGMAW